MNVAQGFKELVKNKYLYLMMLPGIAWIVIFCYVPLYGIQIAFKKFNYRFGIWNSPWAGLDNFKFLFNYRNIGRVFYNTVFLNILFLIAGTVMSVFLALMFVELRNKKTYKQVTQTIAILPHFVSWTVVAMFIVAFIGQNGLINQFLIRLGREPFPFYQSPGPWPAIFVILKIWMGAGFGTIVYIAAITGFDPGMYEAAVVEGATRWQQITRITLPLLKTTIILLTILGIGSIFKGDFGMIYALVRNNALLYPTTDVIDTFTYRALRELNDLGMSTATSLFQSIVGFFFVYTTNAITRSVAPDSAIF